jgi:CBS domain-containing protein
LEEAVDRALAGLRLRDLYVTGRDGEVRGRLSHARLAHLVLAEHRPVGSRRELFERVAGGNAGDLMETHFPHARPDEDLDDVLHRQLHDDVEDMPVLDARGKLLGTVNLTAVLRAARQGALG